MTKKALTYGIMILSKAYKNFDLDESEREIWYSFLKNLDSKYFVYRIREYVKSNRFPPAISDLLDGEEEGLTAEEAWELAREYAFFRSIPKDADPVVVRALDYIGMMNLYMCDSDKVHFLEKDFIRAYKTFKNIEKRDEIKALSSENSRGLNKSSEMKKLMKSLEDDFN
jgi:hypothetical protein